MKSVDILITRLIGSIVKYRAMPMAEKVGKSMPAKYAYTKVRETIVAARNSMKGCCMSSYFAILSENHLNEVLSVSNFFF